MNTDKILAEAIAKDYAPKDNSKIVALKKLDKKAKLPAPKNRHSSTEECRFYLLPLHYLLFSKNSC